MIGLYLLLAAAIYGMCSLFIRSRLARAVVAFGILALWIYWIKIIQFANDVFQLEDSYNHYPFILLGYFLLVLLLSRLAAKLKPQAASALLYYLNTLFVVFIIVEIGLLGFDAFRSSNQKAIMSMDPKEQAIDQSAKPGSNIYLLLFDEYASTASLKEDWGFDNSSFDSFLKDKGFFVNEKSKSNYWWTQFSIASLLNLDYFNGFRSDYNYCSARQKLQSFKAIEHARLIPILEHAGYDLKIHSIFDIGKHPRKEIPDIFPIKRKLITLNTFYNFLVRDYVPYFRYRNEIKSNPAFRYPPFYRMDDYNNEGVTMVLNEAKQGSAKPKFIYAHFMMPHGTYYYDSVDRLMLMNQVKSIRPEQEQEFYLYNVAHTNKKVRQMVDSIQRYDRNAAIIILGDHGYRLFAKDGKHPQYFRNMSALYFPDRDYSSVPDSFTNVNVFRIALNKVCGTHYPLLEDKCFTLAHLRD